MPDIKVNPRPNAVTTSSVPTTPAPVATTPAPAAPPPAATPGAATFERAAGTQGTGRTRALETVPFVPASSMKYECTIHTLQMRGDDGKTYNVVMDLIRQDKNPAWGINEDRRALRAVVMDQSGKVIAEKFMDTPKGEFEKKVGRMDIMDKDGNIAFQAARGPDGKMPDGGMDFDLHVDLLPSGLVQSASDGMKAAIEKSIAALPKEKQQAAKDALALQLMVTDHPRTQHTGSLSIKLPGQDKPLQLKADNTPSTVSHHYGNSLTDYVFLSSVPKKGEPSFIAVITRAGVDLDPNKVGPEAHLPVGYILRTDKDGKTSFSLLNVDADKGRDKGAFDLGSDFLGISLDVKTRKEAGSVTLSEGKLPTRTAFGEVTIHNSALLNALGVKKGETFTDVVIDVTGSFLKDTGRDQPL